MNELVPLGELASIVSGATPKSDVREYWDGNIPWVTPADLSHWHEPYFKGKVRQITEAGLKNCSSRLLPTGAILFSSRAPIGHCAIVTTPLCTNQGFKSLIPNQRLDSLFGYYALRHFTPKIVALGRGATFAEITKEILEDFCIPLPTPPQQQRIAATLERADHLRRTRRFVRRMSDTFLQSVFLKMFGDPVSNSMRWESETLGDLLVSTPQNGLYVPCEYYVLEDGVEMVHMSDLFYDVVKRGNLKMVSRSFKGLDKYLLNRNDILIARRSLTYEGAAKPCLIPNSQEPLIFESSMIRITPHPSKLLPLFLFSYLSDERTKRHRVLPYVTRSTISGINQEGLQRIQVLVPPIEKQQEFANVVQNFERLRAVQIEAERQAEHLFQTLLHQAFAPS